MKNSLYIYLILVAVMLLPGVQHAQAPNLGTAADFVLFSSDGAVSNTGLSQITGNVGTNNGSSTGFGNVNGVMHDADGASAQCSADLLIAYGQLFAAIPAFFPAPLLGNGQTLNAGVYSIFGGATLNGNLILDAQNDPSAVFIFQLEGAFSTAAQSSVQLVNGAQACNVFWKVEGLVDMATGTYMVGTIVANNAAIILNSGTSLEGRALSTTGAVTVHDVLAYIPSGCGRPLLTGPEAPTLGAAECYGIFSGDGPVSNSGITTVNGDVGTNVGLTTGFDPLLVTGMVHPIPDVSTAEAAADLLLAYNYTNGLAPDIELLFPAQFGGGLVLTPHTYLLNGATTFTGDLYLNAEGNTDAVFVIKIEGALSTGTYANVILINGARPINVYWLVNGAVSINDYSTIYGSILSQGAINLYTGVAIHGRALTGIGALETTAMEGLAKINPNICGVSAIDVSLDASSSAVVIYPNPINGSSTIEIRGAKNDNIHQWTLYNHLGVIVNQKSFLGLSTTLETGSLPSGMYFYKVTNNGAGIQSGNLIISN
jgi:hypothetical protein